MQIFKMLLSSLPYHFENFVLIGDFPKSTINLVKGVRAKNKVLCSLSESVQATELTKQTLPVVGSLAECTTFYEANLKGFSSIKPPSGIKQLLPGILFDKTPLKTQSMNKFLSNLNVSGEQANMAVLNLNGAELEYLVEDTSLLDTFNCILVSCSSDNIFDGASNSYNSLISHLKQTKIAYSVFPAEVHPFTFLLIHRTPAWNSHNGELEKIVSENERLEGDIVQLRKRLRESENIINEKQRELEEKLKELQAIKEQQNSLDELQQQLNKDKAWLESELNIAKLQLEQQNQASKITNKLNLKLQVDLDDLRKKYAEKEQNERELSQLIDELYVKLKQASEFYYELEKKYPELKD